MGGSAVNVREKWENPAHGGVPFCVSYTHSFGAPEKIRTPGLLIRSQFWAYSRNLVVVSIDVFMSSDTAFGVFLVSAQIL